MNSTRTSRSARRWVAALIGVAAAAGLAGPASATTDPRPGDLDLGFGAGGRLKLVEQEGRNSPAVAQDGATFLVAGTLQRADGRVVGLYRRLDDGSADSTFGDRGLVITRISPGTGAAADDAMAVVVQKDGRIVVAGTTAGGSSGRDVFLARFQPDGQLDPEFGNDGVVVTDLPGRAADKVRLAVQYDAGTHKLVVAGTTRTSVTQPQEITLLRYTSTGHVDRWFGDLGSVVHSFAPGASSEVNGLRVDELGRLVIAGRATGTDGSQQFAAARYLPHGAPDPDFAGDGTVLTDVSIGGAEGANDVTLMPSGGVLAAGWAKFGSDERIAMTRYDKSGQADSYFDGDGVVVTDVDLPAGAGAVALEPTGTFERYGYRIVVAGQAGHGFLAARYYPNGALDPSFGQGGIARAGFAYNPRATGIIATGKTILVAGIYNELATYHFGMVRFVGGQPGPSPTAES